MRSVWTDSVALWYGQSTREFSQVHASICENERKNIINNVFASWLNQSRVRHKDIYLNGVAGCFPFWSNWFPKYFKYGITWCNSTKSTHENWFTPFGKKTFGDIAQSKLSRRVKFLLFKWKRSNSVKCVNYIRIKFCSWSREFSRMWSFLSRVQRTHIKIVQ